VVDDKTKLKQHELQLFQKWKTQKDPRAFQELYKSMSPLIDTAAMKASRGSNIPQSAHKIYAAQNFMDSLNTYDPSKRALQSHVYDWVHNKAKRLNYQYQNLGHLPETRAMMVGEFQNISGNLQSELGREASTAEIADAMGIGMKDVTNLRKELKKDLAMAEGTEEAAFFRSNQDEEILDYIYHDLTSDEKVVYEYMFGKHGKPILKKPNNRVDFTRIGQRVGFSESKVRSLANKIGNKLEVALKR
jgi:DNA-directed RNA polymerase specialized sigma subunit